MLATQANWGYESEQLKPQSAKNAEQQGVEDVTTATATVRESKTAAMHIALRFFLSLLSLKTSMTKFLIRCFMEDVGNDFFFSLWTWIQSVGIQLQEHSLTFEWAETFPMKFEVMQNQKSQCQRIPAGDLNWHNIKNCSNKFPATKTSLYQKQDLVNDYQKPPVHKFSPSWPEYWLLIKCYATAQCLKNL